MSLGKHAKNCSRPRSRYRELTHSLGDRHCENILFDSLTGDTVHVDLNCLFEKVSYRHTCVTHCQASRIMRMVKLIRPGQNVRNPRESALPPHAKPRRCHGRHGYRRCLSQSVRNQHGHPARQCGKFDECARGVCARSAGRVVKPGMCLLAKLRVSNW